VFNFYTTTGARYHGAIEKIVTLPAFFLLFVVPAVLGACTEPSTSEIQDLSQNNNQIILATTTSTQDSGLLDYLLPIFEDKHGYIVKTIAVGTGQALNMAEDGNADVLLVHAPPAEEKLMEDGYGIHRYLVMHNDFVIVGPENDPAHIQGLSSASQAFDSINSSQSQFFSRSDDSGTHKKELFIWQEAGISPNGSWYLESGQGMASTLRIASEKNAYTLTDRATYLANQDLLHSVILVDGDNSLLNVYHVIVVNPDKWARVNYNGAQVFASFLISESVQSQIGNFGIDRFGQSLFIPDANKTDSDLGLD